MEKYNIRLTSTEIAGLWSTYYQDSMAICISKHLLQHIKDKEIEQLLKESLQLSEKNSEEITRIFNEEGFPVPKGFGEEDVNLNSPKLFEDPFSLSYIYGLSRLKLLSYGLITSNVARQDVLDFFSNALYATTEMYKKSVNLMLEKGIYDRPPMITYPKHVDFVSKQSYLTGWFGEKRPLNTIELTDIFFNIERNYFGDMFLMGFIQVVKDKDIKDYLKKGRKIANKQITILNDLLKRDDLFGTIPVEMEVTDSTVSPFSDKLILALISSLSNSAITYLGHALGTSSRRDLGLHYSRLITEVLAYAEDGINLSIERGWFEQPPQAIDRNKLANEDK